jgi:dTDP-4-amino-4,6-dideoxygalactose transaminase
MIPLFRVKMAPSAPDRVGHVLRSGYVGQGPEVEAFEEALRTRIGNPLVATVNSATSGLHLALHMVASQDGHARGRGGDPPAIRDEVLTTPMTCTATNWPILANRLRIRWVDVDPATLNLDLDDLARKISPATRAVMVVHWAGYPLDLDRLAGILDQAEASFGFRPAVIEDCAHAWGATYRGRPLGNHGTIAVFSFQAIKHLTCGDGGLLVLPDEALHRRARLLRWYGIDRDSGESVRCRHDIPEYGFKFHMNDISAAIGLANLSVIDDVLARHRRNAAHYDAELRAVPGLELTERAPDREPSFWIYTVKVEDRPAFVKRMTGAGITVSEVHTRNDVHSCVRASASILPGLDSVVDRMVSIPVGWWLTEDDRSHILATIKAGW